MNLGFGVNRLFYRSKNTDKKLKAITTLGFLVQVDLLLHSKEKNHYSSYRITKNTGSNPGIKYEESSDTLFKSFDKHYFYFGAGLSFGERVVFKSTYFLELKVNFGITPFQRLVPYMPETNGLYDFKSDFQTSYPYDDLLEFIRPVLQTGISIGYIFPVKKKKAIEPFVGK